MLHLILQMAGTRHALDTSAVIEVLPLVCVQPLAPPVTGVTGVIDYRGVVVPLIDIGLRFTGNPTVPRLGTRIVMVSTPAIINPQCPPAALLVERVLGAAQLKGAQQALGVVENLVVSSPSPQPSPQGRGSQIVSAPPDPTLPISAHDGMSFSLSPGERAGVRGKETSEAKIRFVKDALGFIQFLDLAACLARPSDATGRNSIPEPCAPTTSF